MATAAAVHILVKTEQQALDILKQLKQGKNFAALAKKHSLCPSGKRVVIWASFVAGKWLSSSTTWCSKKTC